MAKLVKWISTAEYVDEYNKTHEEKITRKDVYKMINVGDLQATKNERGHWCIKVVEEPQTELSVKDYVEKYNKVNKKNPSITVKEVREMASKGILKAKKVSGKWVILEAPKKQKKSNK